MQRQQRQRGCKRERVSNLKSSLACPRASRTADRKLHHAELCVCVLLTLIPSGMLACGVTITTEAPWNQPFHRPRLVFTQGAAHTQY